MSTRTLPASEIGREHLGRQVAAEMPTSEGMQHAEGTLRWFAHHESDMVALGIEDPYSGITEEWQTQLGTVVSVRPRERDDRCCLVVIGLDGEILRTAPGNRIYSSRAAAAKHQPYLLALVPDMHYAMARLSLIEDDPHDVPDEDTEGGAPDA